jgi:hypothetical protein
MFNVDRELLFGGVPELVKHHNVSRLLQVEISIEVIPAL